MDNEKSTKKKKLNLKELYHDERGRALLFFGFYFIFFVILIILLRTGRGENNYTKKTVNSKVSYQYHFDLLKKNNYHFNYLITKGDEIALYEGDRYQNKELFTKTVANLQENYFRDGDLFIKKQDTTWQMIDNPYLFAQFLEVDFMDKILAEATFISKTQYDSGEKQLNFQISTTSLVSLLTKEKIDLDDEVNEVTLEVDDDNQVVGLSYDLTPYYRYQQSSTLEAHIDLDYSEFGKIKEIEKP